MNVRRAVVGWAIITLSCVVSWSKGPQESSPPAAVAPTFSSDIAAIIYDKCVNCHRPGQVGPFSLVKYEEVRRHAETIRVVVESAYMPPWKPVNTEPAYANDRSLSPKQKKLLLDWIRAGCPLGDSERVPPPPEFPSEWSLGKPDLIISMRDPFEIPAEGPDLYRSFVFPLDLAEDKWVKAVELRTKAKSAMHHALFFLDDSGMARQQDGADGQAGFSGMGFLAAGGIFGGSNPEAGGRLRLRGNRPEGPGEPQRIDAALSRGLGGYVPGAIPARLPGDLAMALPQGNDIVMQTHFHPSGKPETEQAELGLYLTDIPPTRQLVNIQVPPMFGFGAGIDIPAGQSDFRIEDHFQLPVDVEAIAVGGHAHYLCRTMRMTARFPDGRTLDLLRIGEWDLDWQDRYLFQQAVPLPAGSVITVELSYDNSSGNPENPFSPPQPVRWGRQSTDEMGSVTLTVVAAKESERGQLQAAVRDHFSSRVMERFSSGRGLERMLLQLDEDRDGKLQKSEAPPRLAGPAFGLLDLDRDGGLDRNELQELPQLIRRFRPESKGADQ